jgi:glycosyltransferase involved in cell wall biosynthesis
MRIAYRADPTSINGLYRGMLPMTALAQRGHQVQPLFAADSRPLSAPLNGVDVVFVHRYCDPHALQLVEEAKRAGAAVVWDNDDDIGSTPKSSVAYKHFGGMAWERRLAQMRWLFGHVDLVTAPSRALAQRFRDWGAPTIDITENYLPDMDRATVRPPGNGTTTIGWVAAREHAMDVQQLPILDALQRILDEHEDVRVVTAGLRLGLRSPRYEHVDRIPATNLAHWVAGLDIGIAPLANTDFNRSRSNIKLKEYAVAGTPWLASPIGPYADLGERQGGRLVPDGGWHEAIARLLDKPKDRRKLGKRARRWAAAETITKNITVWEKRLATAMKLSQAARTS